MITPHNRDVSDGWPDGPYRVGISGWRYPPWRKVFYPDGLPQRAELEYASGRLNSIEINGSFYSLQRPSSYQRWHDETPDGFVFAVKGPRFVTHMKKLADVTRRWPTSSPPASSRSATSSARCCGSCRRPSGYDAERLAAFFALLPRTTARGRGSLPSGHDERMRGPRLARLPRVDIPLRHAIEVRHSSFQTPGFVELLREHDIALVCADTAGKWPMFDDITSDFAYVRLHGADELYVSGYDRRGAGPVGRRRSRWR